MSVNKETNDILLHLWAAVDQADVMDLVEFSFVNLPKRKKQELLKNLLDYASQDGCKSGIMPEEELSEWIDKARKILEKCD